jgi:hypothetical protein
MNFLIFKKYILVTTENKLGNILILDVEMVEGLGFRQLTEGKKRKVDLRKA